MVNKFFKQSIKITFFVIFTNFVMYLLPHAVFAVDGIGKEFLGTDGVVSETVNSRVLGNKNISSDKTNKDIGVDLEGIDSESVKKINDVIDIGDSNVSMQSTAFIGSASVKEVDNTKKCKVVKKTKKAKETKKAKKAKKAKKIPFADNEQIVLVLSSRDINRVLVVGDRIQSVNGPTGLYIAKNDKFGSAYISLYSDVAFTIFVSTLKGHNFSLLVIPKKTPGRTVILEPTTPSLLTARLEETESYQKDLITFIKAMINNEVSEDYEYEKKESKNKESKKSHFFGSFGSFGFFGAFDFSGIADIKQIASYNDSYLSGIIYEIKNRSKKPLILKPSYFYQPGVRAIALSDQTIASSASGLLYQVVSKD